MDNTKKDRKIQAIIFDLDNLLVASEQHWPVVDEQYFSELLGYERWKEWQPVWLSQRKQMMRLVDMIAGLAERYNLPQQPEDIIQKRMDAMLAFYREHLKTMPGAHELVCALAEQGYPLAIASGMHPRVIRETIIMMGWQSLITTQASTHEVENNKPDPGVYLLAAERLSIRPQAALAFENELAGVKAAKAAGMACVAVPDRAHEKDEITRIADVVLDSLASTELEKYLPTILAL